MIFFFPFLSIFGSSSSSSFGGFLIVCRKPFAGLGVRESKVFCWTKRPLLPRRGGGRGGARFSDDFAGETAREDAREDATMAFAIASILRASAEAGTEVGRRLRAGADCRLWSDAETNESSEEASSVSCFLTGVLGPLDGVLDLLPSSAFRGGGKLGFWELTRFCSTRVG
jgi:hypothetical protein